MTDLQNTEPLKDPSRKNPYSIKGLKYGPDFGDGPSWQATLLKDGKKIGIVQDSGHGGPVEIHCHTLVLEDEFVAFAKEWRHWESQYEPDGHFVHELLTAFEVAKEEQRIQKWVEKQAAKATAAGFPFTNVYTFDAPKGRTTQTQSFRTREAAEAKAKEQLVVLGPTATHRLMAA